MPFKCLKMDTATQKHNESTPILIKMENIFSKIYKIEFSWKIQQSNIKKYGGQFMFLKFQWPIDHELSQIPKM